MFKYDKIPVRKPDSLLDLAWSALQFILVISGLVGLSVQLFHEQGWLRQALRSLINAELSTLVVTLPVIVVAFLALKSWLISHDRKKSSAAADAMLYVMMAIGAWYIYSYISTGHI